MAERSEHVPGQANYLVCVDGSPQSRVAVRFACLRAKNTGGNVMLLTAIEPAEFQHWVAVEDVMLEERREEAEHVLQDLAAEVNEWARHNTRPDRARRSHRRRDSRRCRG